MDDPAILPNKWYDSNPSEARMLDSTISQGGSIVDPGVQALSSQPKDENTKTTCGRSQLLSKVAQSSTRNCSVGGLRPIY